MNNAQDFSKLYRNVELQVSQALLDISSVKISHPTGNAHLESIKSQLNDIKNRFNSEINYLEEHAEWEKFTIAFFGETNAGKSTLIESLRIIFNERQRCSLIQSNRSTTEEMRASFNEETDELIENLSARYAIYERQITSLASDVARLTDIAKNQNEALQRNGETLLEENAALQHASKALRQDHASLTRNIEKLKQEKETLKAEHDANLLKEKSNALLKQRRAKRQMIIGITAAATIGFFTGVLSITLMV
ncbi:GTPase [Billgrantia ethanolica]|uniref:Uncharacterized protein n=1 Tax=Billgrantia ethanolica TaxID=2733486 RepID=A0ABS9A6H2_9GAMM|nr:GTPase [Halomonas ethanolica]MCE8004423.1 hypothetical protein [Halomonas ethanolica]